MMASIAETRLHHPYAQGLPEARRDFITPYAGILFDDPHFRNLMHRVQGMCTRSLDPNRGRQEIDRQELSQLIHSLFDPRVKRLLEDRFSLAGCDGMDIVEGSEAKKEIRIKRQKIVHAIDTIKKCGETQRFDQARDIYSRTLCSGLVCPKIFGVYLRVLLAKQKWGFSNLKTQREVLSEANEVWYTAEYCVSMNSYIQNRYKEIYTQTTSKVGF